MTDYYTSAEVDTILGEIPEGKSVKTYIDEKDISSQLTDYAKTADVEKHVADKIKENNTELKTYIDNAVDNAEVDLSDYYKKSETYSSTEIDDKLDNVTVDLTGYATEKYVDDKIAPISSSVTTNTSGISSLSKTVGEIQEAMSAIDASPRLTYDIVYNDTEDENVGENVLVLYEIENENKENETKTVKAKYTIVGGGGGSAAGTDLKLYFDKDEDGNNITQYVFTIEDVEGKKAVIHYDFYGTDSVGDSVSSANGTWQIRRGTSGPWSTIATETVYPGEDIEFNVSKYLSVGSYQLKLSVADESGGFASKTWTVQQIDFKIKSDFNDKLTYPIGMVSFGYEPSGNISKDIHFVLDGKEIGKLTTATSGIPMGYDIPTQTHGAHLLEVYMTATVNGNYIESNHILKDIMWCDENNEQPIISTVYQNFTAKQYDATNIEYTVYHPHTENPKVEIRVDDVLVSSPTLDKATNVYAFKTDVVGEHIITITCDDVVKTLKANITKLDINVAPVTAGLVFDFNPSGKSNNDADRLWNNGIISMSVSDNFDWVNGGYQIDDNGDQYFCVKAGTTATINHNLFADDAKVNGKEFKVVFKTTNIKKRDTSFISCMNNNIGLDMKVESANIYSSNSSLYSPYCEEDIIEFEFNINKNTDIPMVLTYEDGVANRPMIYTSDSSFWQSEPQPITIGSTDCDVHIYRMKAYSNSLTDSNILANFIADARTADEMIDRYNRNQIYDENNLLDPEVLAAKCPDLRIIMIDAPWFTNDKDNKVDDTTIRMIYKNGDAVLDNWTCTGARHSGQGTSSNEYGYAGRNIDLIMDTDTSLFTLGDNTTTSKTITLTRNSVPTDYLNVKVNIASSENQNNAQFARRYNEFNPFVRSAKFNDPKVKDTMEFFNCVIFVKERDEDIATHREFLDCNYHFYSIGNVGDSKKTDDTRVNNNKDPKECIVEITDYNVKLAEFPTGNPDGICDPDDWKAGNVAYDYLYAPYKYKDGKFKSFGSDSYEFRYEMKGITEEQREVNINSWRDMYKFVVTSTDEEFHRDLKKYFVVDSALYYYLFTERYTMVDNRAKNSFWHYGKVYITTAEATTLGDAAGGFIIDDEQAAFNDGYRWNLSFAYDCDTSLGIDNTGKLVLTYGKEDTDYYVDSDPSSAYIYRAAESTFFCRLRDLFKSEMQAMFVDRENANAWSANSLIAQWDNAQNQFPEELWRLDIQRKYLRTYQGVSIDNSIAGTANPRFLTEMLNGRKKYQRRMFERNQELYMATKYFGKVATQDQIMMRFNNPEVYTVKPDFTLYLTPYSDMYIGVSFYNGHKENFRAKAGIKYTIPYPEGIETADITLIYGASFIQAIDDLSKCYIGDNDFSKASRLQSLVIGSDVEGYSNSYMKKISLGNNKLLEYLDIRNITGLDSVVDLSQCGNLLELYAQGSGVTGVIFANGGKIEKFYIPSVISLTMKNLNYIEDFAIESYNNLATLIVENTPIIDTHAAVNAATKLQTLRLIGLNWNPEDTSVLDKALTLRGVNNDGGEISQSVLTGIVHVPIIRQQQAYEYKVAWPDLDVIANTTIEQFAVTFVNADGAVLEVQYVDKGQYAVDPTARENNPITIPTKESTISTDFTFIGWDTDISTLQIFTATTIMAVYSEKVRSYTIKYVSKGGITVQESVGLYGTNILYSGDIPTYTLEEGGFTYYLFNRWDKSGFLDGDFDENGVKTVNAIFDEFTYRKGAFDGKELKDLRPVEIYALSKLTEPIDKEISDFGLSIETGDDYSFTMGYDVDYDDIESIEVISEKRIFSGATNDYYDTGIKLFDVDKDFVLALDYKMSSANTTNATLMQCFENAGTNGFRLNYGSKVQFTWGSPTINPASTDSREMLVLRHKKGDNNLYVYTSNISSTDIQTYTMEKGTATKSDIATLIFGAAKQDSGRVVNYGIGEVNWCKIWYKDLGDDICKKLVGWTHENITLETSGFYRYQLHDNTSKESMMSLLATHLLSIKRPWSSSSSNAGGWANSQLNAFLNTRFYDAIPSQIKALIKKISVSSVAGNNSSDIISSGCYVTIPALYDVNDNLSNDTYKGEVYDTNGTISFMTKPADRIRTFDGDSEGVAYWLRSPAIGTWSTGYVWRVAENGSTEQVTSPTSSLGILIELSF